MKIIRRLFYFFILPLALLINGLAALHAWNFTHYSSARPIPKQPHELSFSQKVQALLTGVAIPRPDVGETPCQPYQTIRIANRLEAWFIPHKHPKGTILLFHGYGSNKSSMIGKADILYHLGYDCLLLDFYGHGGSSGSSTSIGFHEAQDVQQAVEYAQARFKGPYFLCGTSMGAAAVMRYVKTTHTPIAGLILECPFASMKQTVANRFEAMGIPDFPLADLLLFYGSVENNFWAFSHNPVEYARSIKTPALLFCGKQDERVKPHETRAIFTNLKGPKQLVWFPQAGHADYLKYYRKAWTREVQHFLKDAANPGA